MMYADCRFCEIGLIKSGERWFHDTSCLDRGCRAALYTVDEGAWLAYKGRTTYAAPKRGTERGEETERESPIDSLSQIVNEGLEQARREGFEAGYASALRGEPEPSWDTLVTTQS